jgi:GntR family transcriptional regulator of abcA and norABC
MKRILPVRVDWQPDRQSTIPVYEQIVRFVCRKIADGEWSIGTRLPSQRALARSFGINRSTISMAIDALTAFGIIEGRHGAGTVIVSNTWSLLLPGHADWGNYVSSGYFRENNRIVQAINQLEFVPNMVRLGTGELDPRLFPQAMMRIVLKQVGRRISSLGYPEPLGLQALRQAVSKHMERIGVYAPPSCILITSGALQALQLISASLLEGGSVVYTEAPTYLKSIQVFQSAGMSLSGVPMDDKGLQFWKIADRLSGNAASVHSLLYTIPTNHNPTGITMPETRRQELLDFCALHRLPVIEDGAYQDLCFDGKPVKPLKALDKGGMVIYLGSASKSLAPGLRIGWIIAPEPIVQRLSDVKMQVDYGASLLSQFVLTEFLSSGLYHAYTEELCRKLRCRRDSALDVLQRYYRDIAIWHVPQGGFYIWLTLQGNVDMELLFYKAASLGILINPGDIYDFGHNRSLRLSYAYTTPEEFEAAAVKMVGILKQLAR